MSTYAVLGATGHTGQSIVQILLKSPDKQINAYCRSKQKLFKLLPDIQENTNVNIFEGQLSDADLLANCIRGTRAVFLAVAVTDNIPGCSIAQDTAHVVISALEKLKSESNTKLPKLVVLSSASLNPEFMSDEPRLARTLASWAFSNVYADLRKAEEFLRSKEDLVSTTFIKPGVLSNDTQKGYELSLQTAKSPLSFMDLAAGMVEAADSEQYDMKNVAVSATTKDVAFPWESFLNIPSGLLFHFFPWMYQYLR